MRITGEIPRLGTSDVALFYFVLSVESFSTLGYILIVHTITSDAKCREAWLSVRSNGIYFWSKNFWNLITTWHIADSLRKPKSQRGQWGNWSTDWMCCLHNNLLHRLDVSEDKLDAVGLVSRAKNAEKKLHKDPPVGCTARDVFLGLFLGDRRFKN